MGAFYIMSNTAVPTSRFFQAKIDMMGYVPVDPNPGPLIPHLGTPFSSKIDTGSHLTTTVINEPKMFEGNDASSPPPSPSWSEAATYGDYFTLNPPEGPRLVKVNKGLAKVWPVTKKDSSSTLVHDQKHPSPVTRGEHEV